MEVSREVVQTLATGDYLVFPDVVVAPSKCMSYNTSTGITTLKGICTNNCYAKFKLSFSGNISSTAATSDASLVVSVDGAPIAKSEMNVVSAAAGDVFTVARTLMIVVPRGTSVKVGIQGSSTTSLNVENAILVIDRVA